MAYLSSNPNAIHILIKFRQSKLGLFIGNPNAIPILEKNIDKINWLYLSSNPNAISLIEQNLTKLLYHGYYLTQMLLT